MDALRWGCVLGAVAGGSVAACSSSATGSGGAGAQGSTTTTSTTTTTATTGTSSGGHLCIPEQQVACACPGGGQGAQVCKPDGSGFDPCFGCPGGSGGQGGASTASTTTAATTTAAATTTTGGGGAGPACPGGPTEIDLHQVTVYSNPPDLADWPVTTTLTEVDFTNDGVQLAFSKQDGSDRWPDVVPPGWDGPLQYTLGMVECINGQWYASAVIEFWYGLPASGGNVALNNQVAANWYYDAGRWGLLAGRQPATGETIGIFVAAGNLRNITSDDPAQSPVMERSNVVLVPMPDVNGAQHGF